MKKSWICVLFVFGFLHANAQVSYFKTGLNLNALFVSYHSPNLTYESPLLIPGFHVAWEKPWGKKFSFTYQFEYTRHTLHTLDVNGNRFDATFSRISFVPEVRFYPVKNQGPIRQGQGLFIESGMRLLSYSFMESSSAQTSGFRVGDHRDIYLGLGVKYPFSEKTGMEMHINTTPYNFINYEGWNTLQTGFKFFWTIEKSAGKRKQVDP